MKRYWHPIKQVTEFIESIAQGKVLELGPGSIPFNKATHFCGHSEEEKSRFQNYSLCDFSSQVFPYENKEFDFVYARHVIEDLNNPVHFLQECKRIAKAGYFETPSPYVEIQKYIEHDGAIHKGYHHHFSYVWTKNNTINILHKYPITEHLDIKVKTELLDDPFNWNNYFLWENDFNIQHWRHEKNFNTIKDYPNLIYQAINDGIKHSNQFKTKILQHAKTDRS